MEITPSNLNVFFSALETSAWKAYSTTEVVYTKICTPYPCGTEFFLDGWIGMLDTMREWVGPRLTRSPAPQTYQVGIQNFELTEQIDRFKLEDDTYGIYYPTVAMMGMNMKKWPDYQVRDLLENAKSQVGARQKSIDQINHWSASHPVDFYDPSKGTYVNDFTGGVSVAGITVGGGLAVNSFATVWQEMASRKSESGEKLGLIPDLTMTPTQLKQTAATILQAQFFGAPIIGNLGAGAPGGTNYAFQGSTENVLKSWSDLLVWPDLSSASNWYQLVANKPVKPFGWVMRQAPDFVSRVNPQDPAVFDAHTFIYGTMARGTPIWRFPWLSARSGS